MLEPGKLEPAPPPPAAAPEGVIIPSGVQSLTPKNPIFYVCGGQGTVDGVLNFVRPLGFLLEKEKDKDKDGNFSVKFESYG